MLKRAMTGLAISTLAFSAPLAAAPEGDLSYPLKKGDTLIGLAAEYFSNSADVNTVLRLNKVSDPRRIPIGKKIKIPRRFLRYEPVDLRVHAVSGPVEVVRKGSKQSLKKGLLIVEGDEIQTGRNGFVSITGRGGSRLSLPSNSRVRLVDARRYLINGLVDVQVKVLEGRGSVRAPKLRAQERYRVGNPVAVTAVRGTEFRVGYNGSQELGLTEVIEGSVEVNKTTGAAQTMPTEAGFGVSATPAGIGQPEELLPAPAEITPGGIQTAPMLRFNVRAVDGARGYRTQIAKDTSFLEVVSEVVSEGTSTEVASLEDGRYQVRTRAIAQSGLEGQWKTLSFRRKRLGVSAGVEKSPLADFFKFAWQTEGSGKSFTSFQLWNGDNTDQLLIDEAGLTDNDIYVSKLPNGSYKWRVGTLQIDEGEVIRVWGPTQEFSVAE